MERLEMLKQAERLAHEILDGEIALPDSQYEELKSLSEEDAIKKLAQQFLENAGFDAKDY